jgi:cytidylate kinase
MSDHPLKTLHPAIVAIDGPAASGKSTVGRLLAERANYLFFDSGNMYRAVTWAGLQAGLDLTDEGAMGALAERIDIDILPPSADDDDGRAHSVHVYGTDVTWELRQPIIEQNVSLVSAHPRVREALAGQQRRLGLRYGEGRGDSAGIVMVGRDIGTVVLPEAPLKVFLEASTEERARRRCVELEERGKALPYEQVLAEIIARDEIDSTRAASPLRRAEDAIPVDTTGLTPDEVVQHIVDLARHVDVLHHRPM